MRPDLRTGAAFALVLTLAAGAAAAEDAVRLERGGVLLAGTWREAEGTPLPPVVILPGSGPTDRDGNNPLGVSAATYRHLAEGLAERGIPSLRVDKRGMFGSAAPGVDANAVTLADYAADTVAWADAAAGRAGAACAFIAGHSEGGLVALMAGGAEGVCGVILLAAPGRRLGVVLREQLAANPANLLLLPAARFAIAELEAGRRVDSARLPPPLRPLFREEVQGFLIGLLAADPAALAAALPRPLLIVQPGNDLQVTEADARALAAARPDAVLAVVPGVSHVLKPAPADRAGNLRSYADAGSPVAAGVLEAVAGFVAVQAVAR